MNLADNYVVVQLGTPVVPFYPFCLGVSLLKLKSRKKGTLIIRGLLGNLVNVVHPKEVRHIRLLYPWHPPLFFEERPVSGLR